MITLACFIDGGACIAIGFGLVALVTSAVGFVKNGHNCKPDCCVEEEEHNVDD